MIDTSEFKNGTFIYVNEKLYKIIWFQHHKPGKGGAIMRTKLKDVLGGSTVEKNFRAGEKFETPEVSRRRCSFLYGTEEALVFMDSQNYEQSEIVKGTIGLPEKFLTENMEVLIIKADDRIIDVELPVAVELEIEYTEPGARGDTVSNVMKTARLKNGIEVKIPLFISTGDVVKIDTRTGKYLEKGHK